MYLAGTAATVSFIGYTAADEGEHEDTNNESDDGHYDDPSEDDDHHEHEYDGEFNHADVEFMQMMIPHHEQAIEMSKLVPGRTDRQELCELGPEIIEVQEAEIEQMHEWLEEAGADAHGHEMDHHEMEGMMTPEEMQTLQCAEGHEFDCLFVEHMIHHHEGAIVMAEDVLEEGQAPRIAELAEEVIEVQEAEIAEMERWQQEWGC